ncbi:MAG: hypothetical protein K2J72_11235 [Oscillospiraceae bacterium]|nr:hypothetical protein [Oscillospiraceae bacterium]
MSKMKWAWISVLAVMILAAPFLTVRETESVSAEMWFDFSQEGYPHDEREIVLPEYPDTVFHCNEYSLWAEKAGEKTTLYGGMPLWSVYFCDLNGDGKREFCSEVSCGSGIIDQHIEVYDYAAGENYALWERAEYDYFLRFENGELKALKSPYMLYCTDGQVTAEGKMSLVKNESGQVQLIMEE